MRTNIVIDDSLMQEAKQLAELLTMRGFAPQYLLYPAFCRIAARLIETFGRSITRKPSSVIVFRLS